MDCCVGKPKSTGQDPCPGCNRIGRPVAHATVDAILKPGLAAPLVSAERRFCRTRDCAVLYYGADGGVARKQDARVRVGIKESEDPIPLCYCFGFSRADVEREIVDSGECTIPAQITSEIKAGRCACEVKNPSGACCLGEVNKAVRDLKLRVAAAKPERAA